MPIPRSEDGQTVIEFAISIFLSAAIVGGCSFALSAEWNRGLCAYLTFENTHASLAGSVGVSWPGNPVEVHETTDSFDGSGKCAAASEKVSLPKLESTGW